MNISNAAENILELLYPSNVACCVCGKETYFEQPPYICGKCCEEINFINGQRTIETDNNEIIVHYAFDYDEITKQLVHDLKYNGEKYKAKSLAFYLNKLIEQNKLEFDVLVPVPLHENRQKQRGYNQCTVLCRELGKANMAKYEEALIRIKDTKMQTLISAEERCTNLIGAFDIKKDVSGKRILLLDDIVTTGSTFKECANILYKNGANIVIGLAIAT